MLIVVGAENNEKSHVLEGLQLVLFILLDAWCVVNGSVVPIIDYYESLGIKEKGKICITCKYSSSCHHVRPFQSCSDKTSTSNLDALTSQKI